MRNSCRWQSIHPSETCKTWWRSRKVKDPATRTRVASTVVFSLGLSPVFTLANDLIIGAAPPERAGAASAISETCSEFGGRLAIAILGSIGTALYRRAMAGSVVDGVPREAAAAAQDALGGAVAAAEQLPGLGAALLDTARRAFTHGLQVTAITSALVVLGVAVLVMVSLRHVRAASELAAQPDADA